MVAYRLVMLADLSLDIIQVAVDTVGFCALTFGATAFHFSEMRRYTDFRTELSDGSVNGNTAHGWNNPLNLVFVLFKVEQNLECAAHTLLKLEG